MTEKGIDDVAKDFEASEPAGFELLDENDQRRVQTILGAAIGLPTGNAKTRLLELSTKCQDRICAKCLDDEQDMDQIKNLFTKCTQEKDRLARMETANEQEPDEQDPGEQDPGEGEVGIEIDAEVDSDGVDVDVNVDGPELGMLTRETQSEESEDSETEQEPEKPEAEEKPEAKPAKKKPAKKKGKK